MPDADPQSGQPAQASVAEQSGSDDQSWQTLGAVFTPGSGHDAEPASADQSDESENAETPEPTTEEGTSQEGTEEGASATEETSETGPDLAALIEAGDVDALLAARPDLNQAVQDRANRLSQKAQAKLKRDAADERGVRQALIEVLQQHEVDPASLTQEQADNLLSVARYNRLKVEEDVFSALQQTLFGDYQLPQATLKAAQEARDSDDPYAADNYIRTLIDGAAASKAASFKLGQIPEGTPLRQEIDSEVKRRVAEEMKGNVAEEAVKGHKNVPTGKGDTPGSTALTHEIIRGMSEAEVNARFDEIEDFYAREAAGNN